DYETHGSSINKQTLQQIKYAQAKRGVIIFTDPDYPGERIRAIIDEAVPGCKHAFLSRHKAKAKGSRNKSLGIEHASIKDIKQALADVYELVEKGISEIKREDLLAHQLIGSQGSRKRREELGEHLQIGYTNGKQLLKRLTMFQITKNQFNDAVRQLNQEDTK